MFAVKGVQKEDLIHVAEICGQEVPSEMKILDIIKLIQKSELFEEEPEMIRQLIITTVEDRRAEVEHRWKLELAMARNPCSDPYQNNKEIEAKLCKLPVELSANEHGNKSQTLKIMTVSDKLNVPSLMSPDICKMSKSACDGISDFRSYEGESPKKEGEFYGLQVSGLGVENACEESAENSPPEGSFCILEDEGGLHRGKQFWELAIVCEEKGRDRGSETVLCEKENDLNQEEDFRGVPFCVLGKNRGTGTGQQREKQLDDCVVLRREQLKGPALYEIHENKILGVGMKKPELAQGSKEKVIRRGNDSVFMSNVRMKKTKGRTRGEFCRLGIGRKNKYSKKYRSCRFKMRDKIGMRRMGPGKVIRLCAPPSAKMKSRDGCDEQVPEKRKQYNPRAQTVGVVLNEDRNFSEIHPANHDFALIPLKCSPKTKTKMKPKSLLNLNNCFKHDYYVVNTLKELTQQRVLRSRTEVNQSMFQHVPKLVTSVRDKLLIIKSASSYGAVSCPSHYGIGKELCVTGFASPKHNSRLTSSSKM